MQNKTLIKPTDNQSVIISALELNKCAYELAFLGSIPGSQIVHSPEITYVATGLHDASMNLISRTTADDKQIVQIIEDTIFYFKQDEVPFRWLVGPSARPLKLDKALKHYGFIHDYDELGLMSDLTVLKTQSSTELKLKKCVTHEEIADFCYIQRMLTDTHAHYLMWSRMAQVDWSAQQMLELYVGYVDGEPVTAGIVCLYGGLAGIYLVNTLPEEQHKGYTQAFIAELLALLKECGLHVAVTSVHQDAHLVYKDSGFKSLCVTQVWGMHEYRQQHEYSR
jgi:GNAT superfamily N-acetyltransferase